MSNKLSQIFIIDRDRAIALMNELLAFYDEFWKQWKFNFETIQKNWSDITYKEWGITNFYFLWQNFTADKVLEKLKTENRIKWFDEIKKHF